MNAALNGFEGLKALRTKIEKVVDEHGKALQSFPKHSNGLTIEAYRTSDEYRATMIKFNKAFKDLRQINSFIVKYFKDENIADIMARRINRAA